MNATKNPSPVDQGLAFQTRALQMILLGPFHVRIRHCYGPPRIVSLQYTISPIHKITLRLSYDGFNHTNNQVFYLKTLRATIIIKR